MLRQSRLPRGAIVPSTVRTTTASRSRRAPLTEALGVRFRWGVVRPLRRRARLYNENSRNSSSGHRHFANFAGTSAPSERLSTRRHACLSSLLRSPSRTSASRCSAGSSLLSRWRDRGWRFEKLSRTSAVWRYSECGFSYRWLHGNRSVVCAVAIAASSDNFFFHLYCCACAEKRINNSERHKNNPATFKFNITAYHLQCK